MHPAITDERGSVSAEFAMILPALALIIALGVSAAQCGVVQVQLADAAADAARMIGRGDSAGSAAARVQAAQGGARMSVQRDGVLVCVTASAVPAGGVASTFTLELTATGCALDDQGGLPPAGRTE
ncbi:TadE family type IV pilus minor pilin [Herbiconiux sp.]|uniref:TadE family type IV pilus minor pilin n=1 Tax=Herbiconiux sp. TaxID=1871186 RepID=UPI0025BEB82A|nr:TadE family type IV pilus minor pilin [Herbiconiux sp.]